MVVLLSACAELGNLNVGKWVHSQVIVKGLVVNLQPGIALLNMYSKCGVIDLALQNFGRMSERNVWTWSAMILDLAQHGLAKEALNLFQQLKTQNQDLGERSGGEVERDALVPRASLLQRDVWNRRH
ncbi:hypothetical protein AAC387_Pa02g4454 [Persea americana]